MAAHDAGSLSKTRDIWQHEVTMYSTCIIT
jgi:hypothetical protein